MRISVLTISMAILLMIISIMELLCAWEIVNPISESVLLLVFYLLCESLPTLALAIILRTNDAKDELD